MEVAATKLRCGGIYLESQGSGKSQEDCKFKANFSYIEGTGQKRGLAGEMVHSVRVFIAKRFDLNSISWNPQWWFFCVLFFLKEI